MSFPALETSRLQLREITEADLDAILRIHSDRDHMRWYGSDPLEDAEGAKKMIQHFASLREAANPGARWGLQRKDTGALIGTCGLFGWHRAWRKCSLGYEIAQEHQGHGFMAEALREVLAWGFREMGLNRIEAQVHPSNAPSLELLRRLGFVQEGLLREIGYWGGQHHDLVQHSLLRRDWPLTVAEGASSA